MSGDNFAAARFLELYFDSVMSACTAGLGSTQPTHPAGAPAVLGPYGRVLAGNPATRIAGHPATDSDTQRLDFDMQHPGLRAVGAQPLSVRLGGLAEDSHQTSSATGSISDEARRATSDH